MNIRSIPRLAIGACQNILACRVSTRRNRSILYVSEWKKWAISDVGVSLCAYLPPKQMMRRSISPYFSAESVIHFGSEYAIPCGFGKRNTGSKRMCVSIYHFTQTLGKTHEVHELQGVFSAFHTSCSITAQQLIEHGVPEVKTVVVPLGVDCSLFRPGSNIERSVIRRRLGIPLHAFVIGSFQKDGVGWGEGLEPKLIKGPDLLVDALAISSHRRDFHVLLSGPARGYVKKNLELFGIPYTHVGFLKNKKELAALYHALDLYVIASRVEGGPLSLFEAWASGVPVVSTHVGMANDHGSEGESVLFADFYSEDIARAIDQVIASEALQHTLTVNASIKVHDFDWRILAHRYYEKLYKPLLL